VEVVLKDLKHLKALPETLSVGVLEQVADRAILESRAKLALPELTGKSLLIVKVRALEILKLQATRYKRAKDRPTKGPVTE
jgi:hypothetical protein